MEDKMKRFMLRELEKIMSNADITMMDAIKELVKWFHWTLENYRLISPEGQAHYLVMVNGKLDIRKVA